jgi:hypothetical protein
MGPNGRSASTQPLNMTLAPAWRSARSSPHVCDRKELLLLLLLHLRPLAASRAARASLNRTPVAKGGDTRG